MPAWRYFSAVLAVGVYVSVCLSVSHWSSTSLNSAMPWNSASRGFICDSWYSLLCRNVRSLLLVLRLRVEITPDRRVHVTGYRRNLPPARDALSAWSGESGLSDDGTFRISALFSRLRQFVYLVRRGAGCWLELMYATTGVDFNIH